MRKALQSLPESASRSNLALEYFRVVPECGLSGGDSDKKQKHLIHVANLKPGAEYSAAYERYRKSLNEVGSEVVSFVATARSPLAFGLAEKSVLENGLRFARPYGVPRIDGSAIKGVMRRVLARRMGLIESLAAKEGGKEAFASDLSLEALKKKIPAAKHAMIGAWVSAFGSQDGAGAFEVFDAWLVPGSSPPLMMDVVTPHHPEYYRGKQYLPKESEEPIPVAFLCVRPEVEFLFALRAPADWHDLLKGLLCESIEREGIGGKTNAGYGRFRLSRDA